MRPRIFNRELEVPLTSGVFHHLLLLCNNPFSIMCETPFAMRRFMHRSLPFTPRSMLGWCGLSHGMSPTPVSTIHTLHLLSALHLKYLHICFRRGSYLTLFWLLPYHAHRNRHYERRHPAHPWIHSRSSRREKATSSTNDISKANPKEQVH